MSGRSEFETEQYFSRDSAMARVTASARHLAADDEVRRMRTKRRGGVSARSPLNRDSRPTDRMPALAQDVDDIHRHAPGDASASACTGDRPALPSPSRTWSAGCRPSREKLKRVLPGQGRCHGSVAHDKSLLLPAQAACFGATLPPPFAIDTRSQPSGPAMSR